MTKRIAMRTGKEIATCGEVERAILKANLGVYVSGGRLVVAIDGDTLDKNPKEAKSTRLLPITKHRMKVLMGLACDFGYIEKKEFKPMNIPTGIADLILSRAGHWPFQEVKGVMCCQSIDESGNIIDREGVHLESGLLFTSLPKLPPMPDHPTKDDAKDALDTFKKLIEEFPFMDPEGKEGLSLSVAIAMLISPLASAAYRKAPLFLVRAPAAGTGKSFLCRIAAAILIGRSPAFVPYDPDETEFEKRLTGVLLQGSPLVVLDNCNAVLKSNLLCQAITEEELDIRPLGTSNMSKTRMRNHFVANGNHVSAASDLMRRCLLIVLDRNEERPELHAFSRDPLKEVLADRGKYIAAALQILRAYILAGCPDKPQKLASFEEWSDIVRGALIWLGEPDPVDSMEQVRGADENLGKLQALLEAWPARNLPYHVRELIEEITDRQAFGQDEGKTGNRELRDAMMDIAPGKNGEVNTRSFGRFLLANADKVRTVRDTTVKLVRTDGGGNTAKWELREVSGKVV